VCEHKFNVTFIEYVATLAHVANVRELKFDVALIEYVVALAHTKKFEKMEANRFCSKRQIPWRNQRKSSEAGAKLPVETNASITSSILEDLPNCFIIRVALFIFRFTLCLQT
jgi:hypothetical protein